MGNLTTWLIVFSVAGTFLAIVLYSLFGRRRSVYLAIPNGLILVATILGTVFSRGGLSKITFLLAIGSAVALIRQLRRR